MAERGRPIPFPLRLEIKQQDGTVRAAAAALQISPSTFRKYKGLESYTSPREREKRLVSQGLCAKCGKEKRVAGKLLGEVCAEKAKQYQKMRREARRLAHDYCN